jgi:hypothetical protein
VWYAVAWAVLVMLWGIHGFRKRAL